MTANEELINYILKCTPEKLEKFMNHPLVKEMLEEYKQEQAVDA